MTIQHRLTKKQKRTDDARRCRVYIANLPITRSRIEVGHFIQQHGFGGSLVVCYWDYLEKDGPHNGRCWVNFIDQAIAQRAIDRLNGQVFDGRQIRAQPVAGLIANSSGQPNTSWSASGQPLGLIDSFMDTSSAGGTASNTAITPEQAVPVIAEAASRDVDQTQRPAEFNDEVTVAPGYNSALEDPEHVHHAAQADITPPFFKGYPVAVGTYKFFPTPYSPWPSMQAREMLGSLRGETYPSEYVVGPGETSKRALRAFIEHNKNIDGVFMRAGVQAGTPVLEKTEHVDGKDVVTSAMIARQYPAPLPDNDAFADSLPVLVFKKVIKVDEQWERFIDVNVVPGSREALEQEKLPRVSHIGEVKAVPLMSVATYISDGWEVWHQVITPPGEDNRTINRVVDVWSMDEPWKDTLEKFSVGIKLSGVQWAPGMTLPLEPQHPDPFINTGFIPPSKTGGSTSTATSGCHIPIIRRPHGIGAGWGGYDLFHQWQLHGRQIKPEYVEDREWSKDPLAPAVFLEEGTGKKKICNMVLPSILRELKQVRQESGASEMYEKQTLYEKKHPQEKGNRRQEKGYGRQDKGRWRQGQRNPGTW